MKINIPGSRPIPPVVVRQPAPKDAVAGNGDGEARPGAAEDPAGPGDDTAGLPPGYGFPGGQSDGGTGALDLGGTAAQHAPGSAESRAVAPATGGGQPPAADGGTRTTSDWFAPRKPPRSRAETHAPAADPETTAQQPLPHPAQQPQPGGHPGDESTQTMAYPSAAYQDGGTYPYQPADPSPTAGPGSGQDGFTTSTQEGQADAGGLTGHGAGLAATRQPPPFPQQETRTPQPQAAPEPQAAPGGSVPFPSYRPPADTAPPPGAAAAHTATGNRQTGSGRALHSFPETDHRAADAEPRTGYRPAAGEMSSDTLVNGIPVVRAEPSVPRRSRGDGRDDEYRFDGDDEDPPRGRPRVLVSAAVLVGLLLVIYGAGLLLNHADVPNGTTVLGVKVGGMTEEEAVRVLNAELGKRSIEPIPVRIGSQKATLDPRVAGLDINVEATVQKISGRDYNPVTVVASLFGGERKEEAVFVVDEDKLHVEMQRLSGKAEAAGQDGVVKFVKGKPVGVLGKPSLALDVDSAVGEVRQAYLQRAGSGQNPVIELSLTQQQPKVTQAEIDRAVREFGEPAMSGLVTVKAGSAVIAFSPERSLPKFLSMRPTPEGRLEPYFDLKVLEELYGSVFDGLKVDHGGSIGPIQPRDVAAVMLPALRETDPDKRVGVIEVVKP